MIKKRKVYAYIVQDGDIVLFEHPDYPQAGIQVPGGTVEHNETIEDAVLREACEETGLDGLKLAHYLGRQDRDMRDYDKDEYHHRHFFYLTCTAQIPKRWQNRERYSSEPVAGPGQLFEFYRCPLKTVPDLIADFDIFISELKRILS
ncbi:MAG: NUDIX hydrolase [Anaerolineae bacterium]